MLHVGNILYSDIKVGTVADWTCVEVRVKHNQPSFKIIYTTDRIDVELKNKAYQNQANLELIKMFTKILKKPVYLISGNKSKKKLLKIENMTTEEVYDTLREIKN